MIPSLNPYPDYKDSGIEWLGEIPAHWNVLRNKLFLREANSRSEYGTEDLLTVSQYTGVTRRRDRLSDEGQLLTNAASLEGYKRVEPGHLVMNIMLAWNGSLGVSPVSGITSPAYSVFEASADVHPWFLHYLFRTPLFTGIFKTESTGVVDSRLRLYPDVFFRIPSVLPSLEEQAAIVRCLDHADRRIRRYIAAKRRLIALLNEQKQAIIHQAVTRGLDPNVRLKPSGVEWLGDVPEHWEVSSVKREFHCLNHRRIPLSGVERGAMTSRTYDYYGASGVIDQVEDYLFNDELLLIAEDGANLVLRNLPLAIIARGKFWVNNHAHILKPRRGNLEYLASLMESINYAPWITGAAQPKLTQDRIMAIRLAVPPRDEQDAIMAMLEQEIRPLRITIESANREIALIREYRTRLIIDVVTGKLDVREAAATLPDDMDADEAEPIDESDEEMDEEAVGEMEDETARDNG